MPNASASGVVKNFRDGTLVLKDGTSGTPKSYTITLEDGNFTYTPGKHAMIVVMDRGEIAGSRKGAKAPGSFSFEVKMTQFTASDEDTLIDVIDQTGNWSDAVSVAGGEYEQFLHSLVYTVEGEDHGDDADHVLTLAKVYLEWGFKEGDQNTIVISGQVLGTETRA